MRETYQETKARESLYESAEMSIDCGMTPEAAVQMLREGWADYLINKQKSDERAFSRIVKS
jgi:hypothetical protein